jgi:hypothetical protein
MNAGRHRNADPKEELKISGDGSLTEVISLTEVYNQIISGVSPRKAFEDFLGAFHRASSADALVNALSAEPSLTGNKRLDALAGAAADYLAKQHRLGKVPAWTLEPERFLDKPWHTCDFENLGMREYLSFASPAEFKTRNIFTDERPLGLGSSHLMTALSHMDRNPR